MQHCCGNDNTLFNYITFSDECTFHISGNRHNLRMWGTENSKETLQHIRDSLKMKRFALYLVKRLRAVLIARTTINWSNLSEHFKRMVNASTP